MNIAGRKRITLNILIIAPLAMSAQSEPIISTSEYIATPTVAANSPIALTMIDGIEIKAKDQAFQKEAEEIGKLITNIGESLNVGWC